jgi:hypothetical protein
MLFIGIDPGKQGAFCFLDPSIDHVNFISLNPDKHSARDIVATIEVAREVADDCVIALELVHSLGGMSAKSNFTFGGMFWRARTILEMLDMNFELVTPKDWQQSVGVPAKKDRDPDDELKMIVSRMAHRIYPSANLWGPRGGLMDGRSDALMIAHYLRLKQGG